MKDSNSSLNFFHGIGHGDGRRGEGGEGSDSGRLTTLLGGMRNRYPAIQCSPAPCSQLQRAGNSRGNKSSCLPTAPASACRGDVEAVRHLTYPIPLPTAHSTPLTSSLPLYDARMQYPRRKPLQLPFFLDTHFEFKIFVQPR